MFGINLSGAEFGTGSRYGYDYLYPSSADLDRYKAAGMELIRLPFKWERMQPALNGPLSSAELGRLTAFLDAAEARGMKVVLDLHNYGRFGGAVIGSPQVPVSAFADFWGKLAAAVKDHGAVWGYGIMNEPHDMGSATLWPTAAQAAVNAIRAADMSTTIIVAGDGWSSSWTWPQNNARLKIADPADNILYEAHVYFDKDGTGTYKGSYDAEGATPLTGVERLLPFLDWLDQNDARGFIGEFGVPSSDPRWLTVLENFATALKQAGLSSTMWGGGSLWGNYNLAAEQTDGRMGSQMEILSRHAAGLGTGPDSAMRFGTAMADDAAGTIAGDWIYGRSGDDRIAGLAGDDTLFGASGDDCLDGGSGADTMRGGSGADSYIVDCSADTVIERAGEGLDRVFAGVSYTLGAQVENLTPDRLREPCGHRQRPRERDRRQRGRQRPVGPRRKRHPGRARRRRRPEWRRGGRYPSGRARGRYPRRRSGVGRPRRRRRLGRAARQLERRQALWRFGR